MNRIKTLKHSAEKATNWLTKPAVMALLDIDDMEYNLIQYEQGVNYLHTYLKGDEWGIGVMERSAIFWAWWKNHWANRDEQFLGINHNSPVHTVAEARKLYAQFNKGSMLAQNIHPNSVVLNETYLHMAQEIVEAEPVKS